ncbi:MAG: tryptophan-rich sensory protein [Oscillospiraceae bacterium]|jgi:hypothetical protein
MGKNCRRLQNIFVAASYLLMLSVSFIADFIPLGGLTTARIAEMHPNLFTPAGYTFAIWGLIYILLALYVIYHLGLIRGAEKSAFLSGSVGALFIVSSLARTAWVVLWHYLLIPSTILMAAITLISLILINLRLSEALPLGREKLFCRIPFSVYFGWVTVASVSNFTVMLVSLGWGGFGLPETFWAIAVILAGLVIGLATTLRLKDIAYGLVFIWAYLGILMRHISTAGLGGRYPAIIAVLCFCLVLLIAAVIYLASRKKRI